MERLMRNMESIVYSGLHQGTGKPRNRRFCFLQLAVAKPNCDIVGDICVAPPRQVGHTSLHEEVAKRRKTTSCTFELGRSIAVKVISLELVLSETTLFALFGNHRRSRRTS